MKHSFPKLVRKMGNQIPSPGHVDDLHPPTNTQDRAPRLIKPIKNIDFRLIPFIINHVDRFVRISMITLRIHVTASCQDQPRKHRQDFVEFRFIRSDQEWDRARSSDTFKILGRQRKSVFFIPAVGG